MPNNQTPTWNDTQEYVPNWDESEDMPQISQVEAGLRGLGQGVSYGSSDEAQARLKAFFLGKKEHPMASWEDLVKLYKAQETMRQKESAKQWPKTYYGSQIAGGFAAPGLGALKVAAKPLSAIKGGAATSKIASNLPAVVPQTKTLTSIEQAFTEPIKKGISNTVGYASGIGKEAAKGAVEGAVTGYGLSEKEGMEALKDAQSDAIMGASIGGVMRAAAPAVKTTANYVAKKVSKEGLKDLAESRAVKSLFHGSDIKRYMQLENAGVKNRLGRLLIDEGIVKPGRKVTDMVKLIAAKKNEYGKKIHESLKFADGIWDELRSRMSQIGQPGIVHLPEKLFEPTMLIDRFKRLKRQYPSNVKTGAYDEARQIIDAEIEKLRNMPPLSLAESQAVKKSYNFVPQKSSKIQSFSGKSDVAQKLENDFYREVKKYQEDIIDMIGGLIKDPNAKKAYKDTKLDFLAMQLGEEIAEHASTKEFTKRLFSPTDYMTGATGAIAGISAGVATGMPSIAVLSLLTAPVHKLIRERGSSTISIYADAISDLLNKYGETGFGRFTNTLKNAAKKGNMRLAVIHSQLYNADKNYKQAVDNLIEAESKIKQQEQNNANSGNYSN